MRRFLRVHINKIETVERWRRFQGAGWTSVDLPTAALRNVDAGATERVDVEFLQTSLLGKGSRVGRAVFFDDLELQLGPDANLIEFKWYRHRR